MSVPLHAKPINYPAMAIKDILLSPGEFYNQDIKKDTIYIHHTAGGHRPDWTIAGWNKDRAEDGSRLRVATAFVIGGISVTDKDASWDGAVCRTFPEQKWAHHLGLTKPNNRTLNAKSIAIELCNYGPLTLSKDGRFYNYVNKPVPAEQVVQLKEPFKGYKYYHKYTDKQLTALKELLRDLGNRFSIDIKEGLKKELLRNAGGAFLPNADALAGKPGLWTHTNVRKDKFDCSPQDGLIDMIHQL